MKSFITLGLAMLATSASAATITVQAGEDFEAVCLLVVQPGDTCYLESGDYYHDGLTRTHGTASARITITGASDACIKGSNTQDRALQIAHDYYTVEGLCFNGEHGSDYVSTAIYVLGADKKSTKNGVTSSVTGFQMFNNQITKFGGECSHFRYWVTHAEVSGNTIQNCGVDTWVKGGGGKVGEAIYIGTALDQIDDGKAPELKLREGSADNGIDVCTQNWIHDNTFRTYGNECVDIKEGSTNNLVENNVCEHQQDPDSGCFGSRGTDNTFRYNDIAECVGAGVRVGGDQGYGGGNNIYGNAIKNCDEGAFNVESPNQGTVCENTISGVGVISYGANSGEISATAATGGCSSYPGDLGSESDSPSPAADDSIGTDTLLPSPAPELGGYAFAPESGDSGGDDRISGYDYISGNDRISEEDDASSFSSPSETSLLDDDMSRAYATALLDDDEDEDESVDVLRDDGGLLDYASSSFSSPSEAALLDDDEDDSVDVLLDDDTSNDASTSFSSLVDDGGISGYDRISEEDDASSSFSSLVDDGGISGYDRISGNDRDSGEDDSPSFSSPSETALLDDDEDDSVDVLLDDDTSESDDDRESTRGTSDGDRAGRRGGRHA